MWWVLHVRERVLSVLLFPQIRSANETRRAVNRLPVKTFKATKVSQGTQVKVLMNFFVYLLIYTRPHNLLCYIGAFLLF